MHVNNGEHGMVHSRELRGKRKHPSARTRSELTESRRDKKLHDVLAIRVPIARIRQLAGLLSTSTLTVDEGGPSKQVNDGEMYIESQKRPKVDPDCPDEAEVVLDGIPLAS